ncbi:MAG: tripartite tricarboxylate transporter TctB family protein [Microvirga sp.]
MGVPPSETPARSSGRRFVRGPQDAAAGVVVIVIAALVLHALSRISTSSYSTFSPALFPRICTYGIVAGGLLLIGRGIFREGPGLEGWPLRPVILVTLAVVAFGVVTPVLGYAIAGLMLLLISGLAARDVKVPALLALSVVLIVASVALFSFMLKLTMPVLILPWASF